MAFVEGLSTMDLLRSAAIVVAYLGVLIGERVTGKSLWLKATSIADLGLGVFLLAAPEVFLGHLSTAKPDVFALWLTRGVGTMSVASSLTYGYTVNKQDVFSQQVLANTIRGLAGLEVWFYFHMGHRSSFTPQHTSFNFLALLLYTLGNLYHLFRSTDFSKSKTPAAGSCLTRHLLVSIVIGAFFTIANLALPNYYSFMFAQEPKQTVLADYAQRMSGALAICGLVYQILALRFADDQDKVAVFKGGLVHFALWVPINAYCMYSLPQFKMAGGAMAYVFAAVFWGMLLNILAVLFYSCKEKKH